MSDLEKGIITARDVLGIAPAFKSTFNGVLSIMRIQSSKPSSKAKTESATSQAASVVSQIESTRSTSRPISRTSTSSIPVSSASTVTSRKRAPDSISVESMSKRTRQAPAPLSPPAEPKTPDHQTTRPANPNLTGDSVLTNASGVSGESTGETTTTRLMNSFLDDTISALSVEFTKLGWVHGPYRVDLVHTYQLPFFVPNDQR
jgi:hypothetical protein